MLNFLPEVYLFAENFSDVSDLMSHFTPMILVNSAVCEMNMRLYVCLLITL